MRFTLGLDRKRLLCVKASLFNEPGKFAMAVVDWRRYYAPILVHKKTGECRLWRGSLFRHHGQAYAKAFEINEATMTNWRCIGVAGLKAKNATLQRQLWKASK